MRIQRSSRVILPDIEFNGMSGFYLCVGNTLDGQVWLARHVHYQAWQGSPEDGIAMDTTECAQAIADAALDSELKVTVNGKAYRTVRQ